MSTTATETLIQAGTWTIDPAHSQVGFAVKHMGIATVRGRFTEVAGTLVSDESGAAIEGTIRAASIETGAEDRDAHLRSDDFLRAECHPEIAYRATSLRPTGDDEFEAVGELTMAGITRIVPLTGEVLGQETDPYGNARVGLELRGSLSRRDFGMTFNQMLGGGNALVGDKVKIVIDASLINKA